MKEDSNGMLWEPRFGKLKRNNTMKKKYSSFVYIILFFVLLGIAGFIVRTRKLDTSSSPLNGSSLSKDEVKKISSDADFITLLSTGQTNRASSFPVTGGGDVMMKATNISTSQMNTAPESIERTSSTNVQVVGIDEPDIVKTDGSSVYTNSPSSKIGMPNRNIMPPQFEQTSELLAIQALPPSLMKLQSSLPVSGEMIISDRVMVIFTNSIVNGSLQLVGYSILNPTIPKKLWELPFSEKSQKISARLYDKSLYLITSTTPQLPRPCPIPLVSGKTTMNIRCTDVYAPSSRPDVDSVYTVLKINPQTGTIDKTVSFIGQMGRSTVYMSADSLYISYQGEEAGVTILNQFISENKGIFPPYIENKIAKLQEYDLSQSTKEIEINSILSQYIYGMDASEKLKLENQLNNTFKRFIAKNKRSFEYTGIIKVKNSNLSIQAVGKVPGSTLNQFSFDEWGGDLRVATTTSGRNPFYMLGGNNTTEQVSDVYVLGKSLEVKGAVEDLGKTERIYSVRFIEDRGYVVTFRQTDPFYILDLSNGSSPQLKGELKIPGYSSYLHPLDTHLILGIGKEQQVKLSLFDVSDPMAPKEISKYELAGEYWSEALDNHHAFLQDPKYKIFFLPGSRGGYVLSYKDQSLSLVKALEAPSVKRGLYLNDYLYIVSDSGITSFKEGSWEKIGEFIYFQSGL